MNGAATSPAAPGPAGRPRLWIFYALTWGLLVANLVAFVRQNAVNLPFSDQLTLHELVWSNAPAWALVDFQYGPHRQGVFFPLTAALLRWTHGDIRCESEMIAAWLVVAAALAFLLPRRMTGSWGAADVLPAAWCLSLIHNETITTTPSLSHSIGPLVLLLLAAHALLIERAWLRWPCAAALALALLFTGFGIFGALCLSIYAALGAAAAAAGDAGCRRPAAAAIAVMAAGWLAFLRDYRFDPASPGYAFPHSPVWDYGKFLAWMVAARCGFRAPTATAAVVGGIVLGAGAAACLHSALRLLRKKGRSAPDSVVALLAGTSLLYACYAAVGRVHLGVAAGMSSRYGALLVPLLLGIFLMVRMWPGTVPRRAGLAAMWLLALIPYRDLFATGGRIGTWGLPREALYETNLIRNGKLAWLWRFSVVHDVEEATRSANFEIFPRGKYALLAGKVARLQALRWGPFSQGTTPADYDPPAGPPDVVLVGFGRDESGLSWLPGEGWLLVNGRRGSWLNAEVRERIYLLPAHARLSVEFAGRHGEIGLVGPAKGFSLPLGDDGLGIVRLSSPAGTRKPVRGGGAADDRDLSFQFGRISVDGAPLYAAWEPSGDTGWAPALAIDGLRGFHGWEKDFGWMDAVLEISVEATGRAWLNVRVGERFEGVKGAGALRAAVDGGDERPIALGKESTPLSIEVPGPGRHVIRLRSEDGAASPRSCGLGQDPRALSYRILEMDVSPSPRFPALRTAGPAPKAAPGQP